MTLEPQYQAGDLVILKYHPITVLVLDRRNSRACQADTWKKAGGQIINQLPRHMPDSNVFEYRLMWTVNGAPVDSWVAEGSIASLVGTAG